MGEDRSTIGLRAQGALAIVLAGLVATCGGDRGDTPLGPLVVIGDGSTQGHQAKKDAGAPAEKRLHLRRVLGEPGLYDRDIVDFAQRWNVWRLGAVAIGANSKWVATGSLDGHVALWRIRDGKRLAQMKVKAGAVTWLRFGPTGRSLYSRHADGTVRQWALPK